MLLIELLKLLISFNFFFNRCSESIFLFSNDADGLNLSVFCSIFIGKILQIYPSKIVFQYDKFLSLQVMMIKLL